MCEYVVACMRPAACMSDRVLEVYVADYELARPCVDASEGATKFTFANACKHDKDLRARVSDGSTLPISAWNEKIFPAMKRIVRQVMSCYHFTPEAHVATAHYKDLYGSKRPPPKPPLPSPEQGELQIMGWDFMLDEDYNTWLIEANAYATLKQNPANEIDVENKTQLAHDIFTLIVDPIVNGTNPEPGRLQQVI